MTKNKRSSKITVIDQNDNHEAMENLYEDVTKFVDKKTLLEYFALVDGSNKSARDGEIEIEVVRIYNVFVPFRLEECLPFATKTAGTMFPLQKLISTND